MPAARGPSARAHRLTRAALLPLLAAAACSFPDLRYGGDASGVGDGDIADVTGEDATAEDVGDATSLDDRAGDADAADVSAAGDAREAARPGDAPDDGPRDGPNPGDGPAGEAEGAAVGGGDGASGMADAGDSSP
ncbi:MAG: hypothetical protein JOZ69_07605, partial [Myxococcales bacterium]|nr:hypothetical protein [Myxococcales bacterium]